MENLVFSSVKDHSSSLWTTGQQKKTNQLREMQKNKYIYSEGFSASSGAFRCGTGLEILFLIFFKHE